MSFWVERENTTCILVLDGKQRTVDLGSDFAPAEYHLVAPSGSSRVGDTTFIYPEVPGGLGNTGRLPRSPVL